MEFAHEEITDVKKENGELKTKIKNPTVKVDSLANERKELTDRVVDLQTRSMSDNLLFFGIKEEMKENTEEVLKSALETQLNMQEFT